MKKRKLTIVANWKANPEALAQARTLVRGVKGTAVKFQGVETVICPPALYLNELSKLSKGNKFRIGAQNVSRYEGGAHTGEITPGMLKKAKIACVLVGHSERRAEGETDKEIREKIKRALAYNLQVILCVGEKKRDIDGEYFSFIKGQLERALKGVPKTKIENVIIAYEPIWAIGTQAKRADTPESFVEMSIYIRKILNELYGKTQAMNTTILYGGSVNEKNAESFLLMREVQGFLVGRASLDPQKFKEIIALSGAMR